MNYKRKHRHNFRSCGLCKPGKKFGEPKEDKHAKIKKIVLRELRNIAGKVKL